MGEGLLVGLIVSSIESFIYDVSSGACQGCFQKYKQKRFLKKLKKTIQDFCLKNESIYIDSDTFRNFVLYHKPFERIMQNAVSLSEAKSIEELTNSIIEEAEDNAKSSDKRLSVDDKRTLKVLCHLVNAEIDRYFNSVLEDGQKYIISKNAQDTQRILMSIKDSEEGTERSSLYLENCIKDATSLSPYKTEAIAEFLCKKMWIGAFEEVETIGMLTSGKSDDLELAISILKAEMLQNEHNSEKLIDAISHIREPKIRNIVIRNIIPLVYFRKGKFGEIEKYSDSEYLKAIMSAIDNGDFSYLFTEEIEDDNGIEIHKFVLNKGVLEAEEWLVKQILTVFMYDMKHFNTSSLIENTVDISKSWLSTLILYDKKSDAISYSGPSEANTKEAELISQKLDGIKPVISRLSDDIEAKFFALIIKVSLILGIEKADCIRDVPEKLQAMHPVKDYIIAIRIEEGNIGFDEVYNFCKSVEEYWLLTNYMISVRDDVNRFFEIVEKHQEILERSERIFFMYIEELVHAHRSGDAISELNSHGSIYGKFFEYWNILLNLDKSKRDEFIKLCKENRITYMSGYSGGILVERLLSFDEYDLAEFYNKRLEMQMVNPLLAKKYKAFILNGKNRQVDALELLKEVFNENPTDISVINAILNISIRLKRKIEMQYIKAAEESDNYQTLVLAAGAYVTNGDFVNARSCNMKAMYMSDECINPAFNQYLGLNLQDKREELQEIKGVEKNSVAVLKSSNKIARYCIHGDKDLPKSPYIWHGDIHLYISDAAQVGIYRKHIGDEIEIDGESYTISEIEPLEAYITRICFENIVKNGSAKAITAPNIDGDMDVDAFISQMLEFTPDSKTEVDWIRQYNNFEDVALPLHMIKRRYNATYTQFIEVILEEPKSCVREVINNNTPKNDKFILLFASLIILKRIGISNEFLCENKVFIPESAKMQVDEDTSEMIAHYANDSVSSMEIYDGKPYFIETDNKTKDYWIKEAGEFRKYVDGIPSIVCRQDWNASMFDQLNMPEILGTPDYDAISIGANQGYTVIGTEAMLTGLSLNEDIGADIVSITNWLISTQIDVTKLISCVTKMIKYGCIYSLSTFMVRYVSETLNSLEQEKKGEVLAVWDALFETYNSLDDTYKPYALEALRATYVSVHEEIENPALNPVLQVFIERLLWLNKLKVVARINGNGELEVAYYQVEEE